MKIISPQLLFFVLLSINVFSQQRLDSLKYYYSLQISENERYELLSEKVFTPVRAENSDFLLYFTNQIYELAKKIEDYNHMAYAYFGFGENAYLKKKYIKEILNYQKSNLISKEKNNNSDLLKRSHYGLYLSYLAIGDYQKVLVSYQKFKENEERIQNDDNKRALFKQNLMYEHEKELQKKENEIIKKNNRITEKNRVIIITIVAFLILPAIVRLLIKRCQLLKDKKVQEKFSHDLLMTQENERKRISEDLQDGLGQSLLFVKNEIAFENHEKFKKLINSSIEEMRTIARSLYTFQLNNIGIVRAIDNLIVQLNDSTQVIYFFSEIEIKNDVLSDLQQVNTFRIVQECLSNIVKHAKGTSAKVCLTTKNKKVNIRIQDNGVRFNFSKKYSILDTLGLKTIQERVNFLKGTLEINSKKGQGTSFSIIFSTDI